MCTKAGKPMYSKSVCKPGDFLKAHSLLRNKSSECVFNNIMMIILTIYWELFDGRSLNDDQTCVCWLLLHVSMRWSMESGWRCHLLNCFIVWSDSYACCKHNLHHYCFKLVKVYLSRQMKQAQQDLKQLLSFHGSPPCLLHDCLRTEFAITPPVQI